MFREDTSILYCRVPEDKKQSPEIKGIGLPITEPVEHSNEYGKQRKGTQAKRSKYVTCKLVTFDIKIHYHECNYFSILLVLLLPNFH